LTVERVHYNFTLDYYITGVNNAHASGNVRVCNDSTGGRYFYIKEYDPDNKDDHFTYAYLSKGSCDSWDISGIVDGTNKQAEIYVQTLESNSVFSIYD
jgi:hypothetical protein